MSEPVSANNRRKHFLINKPLQLRYMAYIILPLFVVSIVSIVSLYFGIWGSILDAFSDEQIRNDLLIASRLTEYEQARLPYREDGMSSLSFFKQTERLSKRQREVFHEILHEVNRKLFFKFLLLLFFIAWGSIYISHKIAGPLYRFHATLSKIEDGDLRTRIRLRKGDEAQHLADRFNQTFESLDQVLSHVKNIIRENEDNPERLKTRLKEELAKVKTSGDR